MTFKLYKGGSPVWSETQVVDVDKGNYSVYLGAVTPLDSLTFDRPVELGITIDGDPPEMAPRTPLAAAAFAMGMRGMYTFYRENDFNKGYNVVGGSSTNVVGAGVVGGTIGGGGGWNYFSYRPNSVLDDFATVGGGLANTADGQVTTIAGGENNGALAFGATVGGGSFNWATQNIATVCGGANNGALGAGSTVAGGGENRATGLNAAIGGGNENRANGRASVVPGGESNRARGDYSFAAGQKARAAHDSSFVWSDGTVAANGVDSLVTSGPRQFLVKATGGISFFSSADTTTGVYLAPNSGSWASVSDVNTKTGFDQPNPADVLQRLEGLPIKTWRYKGQDESIRHMGPMAQDFHAAFGLGVDDKHIVNVDADGVALVAIQGLYELVKEQQAEIERMQAAMRKASIE